MENNSCDEYDSYTKMFSIFIATSITNAFNSDYK